MSRRYYLGGPQPAGTAAPTTIVVGTQVRLRLRDFEDQPEAGVPFTCEAGGRTVRGVTGRDGELDILVPAGVADGVLRLHDEGMDEDGNNGYEREYALCFAAMPAVDECVGAQKRLQNLGLYAGAVTGQLDDATRAAVRAFQTSLGWEPTGELDGRTRRALVRVHGG